MNTMEIHVSIGEFFDKISILEIKRARIADPAKRANVELELNLLQRAGVRLGQPDAAIPSLLAELKTINETIWDAEDLVREFERDGEFGQPFIDNARATYRNNDRRAKIKRKLNEIFGSTLMEEKSHVRR